MLSIVGGVVVLFVVGIFVFWVGVVDGVGFYEIGLFFKLFSFFVFIGFYGFCYFGYVVFFNIYFLLWNWNVYNKVLGIRCVFNINYDLYIGSCLCCFMNMLKERCFFFLILFVVCVLICSFILCMFFYFGMVVMGFIMFGEDIVF